MFDLIQNFYIESIFSDIDIKYICIKWYDSLALSLLY